MQGLCITTTEGSTDSMAMPLTSYSLLELRPGLAIEWSAFFTSSAIIEAGIMNNEKEHKH